MKRTVSLLLSAALLLGVLGACQGPVPEPAGPESQLPAASEIVDAVFSACGFDGPGEVERLTIDGDDAEFLTAYLENAYGMTEGRWEDAAVIRATGASAFELAVLRMADEDAAVLAASSFMSYISARQGDFAGYAPDQADMVANGSIAQTGAFAALFICPDTAGADAAFRAAVSGEPDPGQSGTDKPIADVKELRDFLVSYCGMDGADLELLDDSGPDALSAYVEEAYGLEPDQWEEAAIARGTGDSAFEVAVMWATNDWTVSHDIRGRLDGYLDDKERLFQDDDAQSAMLRQAISITAVADSEKYGYIVLLACEDAKETALAFDSEAGTQGIMWSKRHKTFQDADADYPGRSVFIQPNKDDMSLYDTSAIRAAWEKGDPAELSNYDKDIYSAAKKVLGKILKDGMDDLEKETAIYSWVVNNVNYDWTHQNVMVETPRESYTPYGGLVDHKSICLGYATTFQLLCDLAGVECITVPGAAFSSTEDHAWNMVRLNGEWYCVDVTWDANCREQIGRGKPEDWDYFNVTSNDMADTDHQWDYANTPEATAEDHGRG